MLYKRYGNPLELLATYSFGGLMDFILYLFEQDNEDVLFDIWLHKENEMDFPAFKKKHSKTSTNKIESVSEEEEKALIEEYSKFIKPR